MTKSKSLLIRLCLLTALAAPLAHADAAANAGFGNVAGVLSSLGFGQATVTAIYTMPGATVPVFGATFTNAPGVEADFLMQDPATQTTPSQGNGTSTVMTGLDMTDLNTSYDNSWSSSVFYMITAGGIKMSLACAVHNVNQLQTIMNDAGFRMLKDLGGGPAYIAPDGLYYYANVDANDNQIWSEVPDCIVTHGAPPSNSAGTIAGGIDDVGYLVTYPDGAQQWFHPQVEGRAGLATSAASYGFTVNSVDFTQMITVTQNATGQVYKLRLTNLNVGESSNANNSSNDAKVLPVPVAAAELIPNTTGANDVFEMETPPAGLYFQTYNGYEIPMVVVTQ